MAKNDPMISFVIPIYRKSPEVFEKCLKSLFDMSYKAIEVICVFDGKNQELEDVAARYKTQRITIEQGGAPRARNEGYKHAIGNYVSFWDADCYAKPEMARRWIEEFQATQADFVYSGYEFVGHMGLVPSHPFDPYMLTCGNYIATMFPMRREIFPGFDESLKGAQDWDLWLTLAEKGFKGSFIQGEGFQTEPPSNESISGNAWNAENYRKTFDIVREKHGIPKRDIVIASEKESVKGLHIAKLINADFHVNFDFRKNDYKLALQIGISMQNIMALKEHGTGCVRAIYWTSEMIEAFENYEMVKGVQFLENLHAIVEHQFTNELFNQKRLKRFFDFVKMAPPELVPLPSDTDEAETTLPEKYAVLLDIDEMYLPIFKTIKQDLPYIRIDDLDFKTNPTATISDYSLLVSFQKFPSVNEGIRRFLINGRNVISNVQAPYCGNFDMDLTMKDFKQNLIKAIRDGRYLKFNKEAQDFYKTQVSPDAFASKIKTLIQHPEMVIV